MLLEDAENYGPSKVRLLWAISHGNVMVAQALRQCEDRGVVLSTYLDYKTVVDLFLSSLCREERQNMVVEYIGNRPFQMKMDGSILVIAFFDKVTRNDLGAAMEQLERIESSMVPVPHRLVDLTRVTDSEINAIDVGSAVYRRMSRRFCQLVSFSSGHPERRCLRICPDVPNIVGTSQHLDSSIHRAA